LNISYCTHPFGLCAYVTRLWKHSEKQQALKILKRENGNDAPMAALTSLISVCDTSSSDNRPEQRPSAMSIAQQMCAMKVFDQPINQLINQ
jgi:hypothetical protein